jgi:hypothetical protein
MMTNIPALHFFLYCIATILQNEVTKLKSATAAPSTEEIGNSEEDRQNLIQVVKMASVNVSLLEALFNVTHNIKVLCIELCMSLRRRTFVPENVDVLLDEW